MTERTYKKDLEIINLVSFLTLVRGITYSVSARRREGDGFDAIFLLQNFKFYKPPTHPSTTVS